jgi:hypothetical protein
VVPYQDSSNNNNNNHNNNNINFVSRFSLLDKHGVDFVASILTATILPKIAINFF